MLQRLHFYNYQELLIGILKVRRLFITNFDIIHAIFQVTDKEKIPQLAKISCFETRQRAPKLKQWAVLGSMLC